MALDPFTAIAIGSGISALSNGISGIFGNKSASKQSDQDRAHQWSMWNATNDYNTPLNQRLRMEQAGFNPNLMAGAPQNTTTQANLPDSKPLDFTSFSRAGEHLGGMFQKAMMTESELLQNEAKTNAILTGEAKTGEELNILKNSRADIINLKREQLNGQILQNAYKTISNSQLPDKHRSAMEMSAQQLNNARLIGSGHELDNAIKRIHHEMWKNGVSPSDPTWLRVLTTFGQEVYHKWIKNNSLIKSLNTWKL